jgi:hypothetical protein
MKRAIIFLILLFSVYSIAQAEKIEVKQLGMTFNLPSGFKKERELTNSNGVSLIFSTNGTGGSGRQMIITGFNRIYPNPAEVAEADCNARKADKLFAKVSYMKITGAEAALFCRYNDKLTAPLLYVVSIYTKKQHIGIEFQGDTKDAAAYEKVIREFLKTITVK